MPIEIILILKCSRCKIVAKAVGRDAKKVAEDLGWDLHDVLCPHCNSLKRLFIRGEAINSLEDEVNFITQSEGE